MQMSLLLLLLLLMMFPLMKLVSEGTGLSLDCPTVEPVRARGVRTR